MSTFMEVDDENVAPYQTRFLPERGSGSMSRPLGGSNNNLNIMANARESGIHSASKTPMAYNTAYSTTPSRLGASFADTSMAEFSPLNINRSSIMPSSAYTPTSAAPHATATVHSNHHPNHRLSTAASTMDAEPMAVSPMFIPPAATPVAASAAARTPLTQGERRGIFKAASAPNNALSLLSQDVQRLVAWENPVYSTTCIATLVSTTLLLSSPPASLLLLLPSSLSLLFMSSALSPYLSSSPLPPALSPAMMRSLGVRALDALSVVCSFLFDTLLLASQGSSPTLTFTTASLLWALCTAGIYISLSSFAITAILLTFSALPLSALATPLRSRLSAMMSASTSMPPAARLASGALIIAASSYVSLIGLRVAMRALPMVSLIGGAAMLTAAISVCCHAHKTTPLAIVCGSVKAVTANRGEALIGWAWRSNPVTKDKRQ